MHSPAQLQTCAIVEKIINYVYINMKLRYLESDQFHRAEDIITAMRPHITPLSVNTMTRRCNVTNVSRRRHGTVPVHTDSIDSITLAGWLTVYYGKLLTATICIARGSHIRYIHGSQAYTP